MAVITGTRMFDTNIDIQADARRELVDMLNQQLADVITLHAHTKQAHWNIKGERFFQLHELYDELADDIFGYIDDTAERVTALGGTALGTTELAANATTLACVSARAHLWRRNLEVDGRTLQHDGGFGTAGNCSSQRTRRPHHRRLTHRDVSGVGREVVLSRVPLARLTLVTNKKRSWCFSHQLFS